MSRSSFTKRSAFAVVSLSVASVAVAAPAFAATHPADPSFTPNAASSTTPDFVGVGSDTSEMAMHLLAEGITGVPGFNAGKTEGRLASFAAKDDANPTIVLRAGSPAIPRPNGSTPGKNALHSNGNNPDVSYGRSSSALNTAEVSANLFAYPFAVDGLKLAVSKNVPSNAPATITPAQMVSIYQGDTTNWNQIGGQDGVIKAYVPPSTSGTRGFFQTQLNAANGGRPVTIAASVQEVQEHSDAAIKDDRNAVAPFSTGRAKSAEVTLTGGFFAQRALYNVLRQADTTKPAFTAIFGKDGFICSDAAEPLIAAAGFEQLASLSERGVCGVPTQAATTNFKTAEQAEGTTESATALTAQGSPNGQVRLTAEVDPGEATGTVTFFEGANALDGATNIDVDGGEAVATLAGVTPGQHTYTAKFTSDDIDAYGDSESAPVTATVADAKYDGVLAVTNPATTWGNTKTVTATLKSGGNNATGSVKLVYGDAAELTATLNNGVASFALPSTLAAGSYWGVVHYAGDSNFAKDFSLVKITVTRASTKTVTKLAASSVKVKKATSATVTVAVNGTTQRANGTVTLKVGGAVVGTGKVVNGVAKVAIKAQKAKGRKVVTTVFTPSTGNYAASAAPAVAYTVVK